MVVEICIISALFCKHNGDDEPYDYRLCVMFYPTSSHAPLSQVQVASSAPNFQNTVDRCTAGSKVKFVDILRNMYVVDNKKEGKNSGPNYSRLLPNLTF